MLPNSARGTMVRGHVILDSILRKKDAAHKINFKQLRQN